MDLARPVREWVQRETNPVDKPPSPLLFWNLFLRLTPFLPVRIAFKSNAHLKWRLFLAVLIIPSQCVVLRFLVQDGT